MTLSQSHRSQLEKARSLGGGDQGVGLTDADCLSLIALIAQDLGFTAALPEIRFPMPTYFEVPRPDISLLTPISVEAAFGRLLTQDANADTYFACLATLHKARVKYARILATQPLPTMDQVGPRSLLQFGEYDAASLASLLTWRKWVYDLDNRAAQETGYLFEPIIAHAIGGTPAPSRTSPVRRKRDGGKGRQVDCVKSRRAYEIKLRVTIAASGQGRWAEEVDFPADCRASGFDPVLVVLDPTPNEKLRDLEHAFQAAGGVCYVGEAAWSHLRDEAGATMGKFLERYVHAPLDAVLRAASGSLRDLTLRNEGTDIVVCIGRIEWRIDRRDAAASDDAREAMPDDAADLLPGT